MPDKSLVVETMNASDRNIVMHFTNNQLVGINFWQGQDAMDLLPFYLESNKSLFKYLSDRFENTDWSDNYEQFQFLHNSPDYWEILGWIDDRIWEYVNIAMRIEELELEIKSLKEKL